MPEPNINRTHCVYRATADKKDASVGKPANNNQFNWVLDLTAEQFLSLAKLQSAMEFFAIGFAIAGFAIGLMVGLAF